MNEVLFVTNFSHKYGSNDDICAAKVSFICDAFLVFISLFERSFWSLVDLNSTIGCVMLVKNFVEKIIVSTHDTPSKINKLVVGSIVSFSWLSRNKRIRKPCSKYTYSVFLPHLVKNLLLVGTKVKTLD